MIGDQLSDLKAAKKSGIKFIYTQDNINQIVRFNLSKP